MPLSHTAQRHAPKVFLLSLLLASVLLFPLASYGQKQNTTRKRPAPASNASSAVSADIIEDIGNKISELVSRQENRGAKSREIKNLVIANPGLVNHRFPNSWSMLHFSTWLYWNALSRDDEETANVAAELIHFQVNNGANIEYKDDKENPARDINLSEKPSEEKASIQFLRAVAADGDIRSLKVLFALGADANQTTKGKDTPLMAAARNRQIEAVKLLLSNGANASLKNDDGATARSLAIDNGDTEIAKLLLPGAKPNFPTRASLRSPIAIPADVDAKLRDLTSRGENIGASEILEIKSLVAANSSLTNFRFPNSYSLLHLATVTYVFVAVKKDEEAANAGAELIQFLVSKGANLKYTAKDGKTALDLALMKQEDGGTRLHGAAVNGDARTVRVLFALGADANPMQKGGYTPLMFAASQGHIEIVKLLLANGANPSLKSDEGILAINEAIDGGHTEIVKLLSSSAKMQGRKK